MPEALGGILGGAQVHAHAADDVRDVPFAFAQVGILRLIEQLGDLLERVLQRGLGVQAPRQDDVARAIDEHRVVQHEQLRVEEVGVLASRAAGDARLDVLDLGARARARLVEALQLARHERFGHDEPDVARAVLQHERRADADTR